MKLRFVQISDHHLAEQDLLWGYSTWHALRSVVRHIAANAGPLDFIVSSGDLVEAGNDAEYRVFRDLIGAQPAESYPGPLLAHGEGLAGVPFYVLPGNHDLRPALLRNLFPGSRSADRLHTWFEHGGVRFVCVDWGAENKARSTPEMTTFLDQALGCEQPVVFLMHHHVAAIGHSRLDRLIADDIDAFAAQIAGRNILAILAGHTHATYERSIVGIPVYGVRSTCFQFAEVEGELLRCLLPPHYRIVTIENGTFSTELVEVPL
ncbi:MAG: hypothetical protein HC822_16540 [Oscillochloris sp.]|nr:hypothetical protein [Oscillochloris sp.]